MTSNKVISTREIIIISLMTSLIAVSSQIVIPLPSMVPINMGTFAVILTATLLGMKRGVFAVLIFLALGMIGVPVFASFRAGPGVLLGPTGGYLVGYVVMAAIIGYVSQRKSDNRYIIASMVTATAALYAFGSAWFMHLTSRTLWETLLLCVFPFIIGDVVKGTLVLILTKRLKPYVRF